MASPMERVKAVCTITLDLLERPERNDWPIEVQEGLCKILGLCMGAISRESGRSFENDLDDVIASANRLEAASLAALNELTDPTKRALVEQDLKGAREIRTLAARKRPRE